MSHRTFASAILVIALNLAPCVTVCAGWSPSRHDRMACCKGAHHSHDQAAADTCCAISSQGKSTESPAGMFVLAVPAFAHNESTLVTTVVRVAADETSTHRVNPHSDIQALFSVFLI